MAPALAPTTPFVPFARPDLDRSIPERFGRQVVTDPDRLAVKTREGHRSYAELDLAANAVAHAVLARRGEGEEPVALLLGQGLRPIVAILGLLKAGKAYVPLDPAHPRARSAHLLQDSGAALLVTEARHLPMARELSARDVAVLSLDDLASAADQDDPGVRPPPDRLAYVMYTSGSTGRPKGVMGTHRTVLHDILGVTNALHICRDDRQTLLRSVSFNGSVRDIFGTLLNGGSLHHFDVEAEGVEGLADWLEREGITTYRSVISVFRRFASTLVGPARFPRLRLIHVGGEPVHPSDVELFRRHFDDTCLFVNGLGITEAGSVAHFFVSKRTEVAGLLVPVGYPAPDMDVLLLDEEGREVAPDMVGEIAVRSEYLSPGYWRRPDLTQARFRPDPRGGPARMYLTGDLGLSRADGCLVHHGRKDLQVKIRGHRVELEEVEAALLALDDVRDAAVLAWADSPEELRLVAYVVPAVTPAPTASRLRRGLSGTLPAYMIPAAFVLLEAIPVSPMGKVDRGALPSPPRTRPSLDSPPVAPRTPMEDTVARIWAEVLGIEEVGVADDFLDLGGNSLLATRIVVRVLDAFRVRLRERILLESPTVERMAIAITAHLVSASDTAEGDGGLAPAERGD